MNRRYVILTIIATSILLILKLVELDFNNLQNEQFGWIIGFGAILVAMCYILFFKLKNINQ